MVEGRASEFDIIQLHFFHGDIRDSRKYDTFREKQAVLFINLLGKGLTQEINGDVGSIWWAPDATKFALLSVFTLKGTFCPRSCSISRPKGAKSPLSVDERHSKTSLLKLPSLRVTTLRVWVVGLPRITSGFNGTAREDKAPLSSLAVRTSLFSENQTPAFNYLPYSHPFLLFLRVGHTVNPLLCTPGEWQGSRKVVTARTFRVSWRMDTIIFSKLFNPPLYCSPSLKRAWDKKKRKPPWGA